MSTNLKILLLLNFICLHICSSEDVLRSLLPVSQKKFQFLDKDSICEEVLKNFPDENEWSNINGLRKDDIETTRTYEKVRKDILSHNVNKFKNGESHVYLRACKPHLKKSGFKLTNRMKGRTKRFLGFMACKSTLNVNYSTVPRDFSWRNIKDYTVVDQGDSGSCWAISAAHSLQYFAFKNDNISKSLSIQQACDCSTTADCLDGGSMVDYVEMLMKTGVASEETYSFTGRQSTCKLTDSMSRVLQSTYVRSYCYLNTVNETELLYMIHQYGPIPVAICSYHTVFLYYGGGIITSADYSKPCIPDHAVLCVGFGTCPYTGLDYWLFKNSWGRGWGEGGYFRIQRGDNVCSIMDYPEAFVIVKK